MTCPPFRGEPRQDYKTLNLPLDADRFIIELQAEMREALSTFDSGPKKNCYVHIGPTGGGWNVTGRPARSA